VEIVYQGWGIVTMITLQEGQNYAHLSIERLCPLAIQVSMLKKKKKKKKKKNMEVQNKRMHYIVSFISCAFLSFFFFLK
jgi:hypothetical protein